MHDVSTVPIRYLQTYTYSQSEARMRLDVITIPIQLPPILLVYRTITAEMCIKPYVSYTLLVMTLRYFYPWL